MFYRMGMALAEVTMIEALSGITVSQNDVAGSARIEIALGDHARPLAYRVSRQLDGDRYVIHDPFGAAIDGVSTLERAVEIATGLAGHVREWAGQRFEC